MKIVADDKIPFLRGVFEPYADVVYLPGAKISPADVADADALIVRTRTKCGKALLAGSNVKIVATATIGFDHLRPAELDELGIQWANAPGCNAQSVKQYIASALASLKRDLSGMTLGIIGVGHVGKLVAQAGEAFGMRVLKNDPPRAEKEGDAEFCDLDTLLRESDIITVHVPLERGGKYPTLNMADEKFFASAKRGAIFFNSCRGEVVVPEAFKAARRSGQIAGALFDVWPQEPDLDPELIELVDFGTPHIAGYSKDGKANGTAASVQVIARKFGIEPLYCWKPAENEIPSPVFDTTIEIDGTLPLWEQLNRAVLHTYEIMRDVNSLYSDPSQFEALRGGYWNRREFTAFTVCGASEEAAEKLAALGFKIA